MKTIIFGSPSSKDNLEFHIEEKLREYGYHVISVSYPFNDFKYKNLKDKLVNTFRKIVLQDKTSKHKLKFKPFETGFIEKLSKSEKADYALIIRSDIYPENFIKLIREKSELMIGYQWDGLDVFPLVKNHIPYYDTFCIFDPNDLRYKNEFPNFKGVPNFFFETDIEKIKSSVDSEIKTDVYYLGSYKKDRLEVLEQINNKLKKEGFSGNYKIFLPHNKSNTDLNSDFEKITESVPYYENLINTYQSKILVDLVSDYHKGLSFRFFEAMGFEKKIITNNKNVKNYDFYNPQNIFIWGEDEDLSAFLNSEYQKLPEVVYEKYSFRNWLKNILQEEDRIENSLPE